MMGLITVSLACAVIAYIYMTQTAKKPAKKSVPVRVRRDNYPQA